MKKPDIATRSDLEQVLEAFYKKVFTDAVIAHFFTTVVPLDLKTHLPVIADFWEAVVLGTHRYQKNVMAVHQQIDAKAPIEKIHLDRWVLLFTQTVDAHFEGPNATLMTQRAASIAMLMQLKLGSHPIQKLEK